MSAMASAPVSFLDWAAFLSPVTYLSHCSSIVSSDRSDSALPSPLQPYLKASINQSLSQYFGVAACISSSFCVQTAITVANVPNASCHAAKTKLPLGAPSAHRLVTARWQSEWLTTTHAVFASRQKSTWQDPKCTTGGVCSTASLGLPNVGHDLANQLMWLQPTCTDFGVPCPDTL